MTTTNKVLTAAILVLLTAGPAYPQKKELLQLQNDVINLQQKVNQLQASVDEKNRILQTLVEKIADTVSGLNGNITRINQTVDGVNSHTDRSVTELKGLITTMSGRVTELADGLQGVKSQLSGVSQQITAVKTTSEALPSADESWRTAIADIYARNYDLAISELADFQAKYPGDPRSIEIFIYRGNIYFDQKRFDQALIEYDSFLQKAPESDNTKTALYKKGLTQLELNDSKSATATFTQVQKQYPNSVEGTNAAQKLKDIAAAGARGRRP